MTSFPKMEAALQWFAGLHVWFKIFKFSLWKFTRITVPFIYIQVTPAEFTYVIQALHTGMSVSFSPSVFSSDEKPRISDQVGINASF